jgi:hypothetical protein
MLKIFEKKRLVYHGWNAFSFFRKDLDFSVRRPAGRKLIVGPRAVATRDQLCLGSWIDSTVKDIKVRKGKTWSAMIKMNNIWTSNLPRHLKIQFFKSTVETILLYRAENWTLTKEKEARLDGCYTRLLRTALNISWKQRVTNNALYGDLPTISETVRERRLRFAGHLLQEPTRNI